MSGSRILAMFLLLMVGLIAGLALYVRETAERPSPVVSLPVTHWPTDPALSSTPPASPATQPITAVPASTPAPVRAYLVVGSQQVWFPPALISFTTSHGQLSARLFTDDPPEAIEADYVGNSFDLDMPLNVSTVQDLRKATWMLQSTQSMEYPDDSPHGVFIHGQQQRLHPQYAAAQFFPQRNGQVIVVLRGWFLSEDATHTEPGFNIPQRVAVFGRIIAQISKH